MKRMAMIIVSESRAEDGGYIPVIVKEGEGGFFPMTGKGKCASPWNWGTDREIAQQCADDYNEKLGLTKEEVAFLAGQSMKSLPNQTKMIIEFLSHPDSIGYLYDCQHLIMTDDMNGIIQILIQIDELHEEVSFVDVEWEHLAKFLREG